MQETAHAIEDDLRDYVNAFYDDRGSIGNYSLYVLKNVN